MRDPEKGTFNGDFTYCTVNGWDCPYYKDGICHIDDPMTDCDDFSYFFDGDWDYWVSLG